MSLIDDIYVNLAVFVANAIEATTIGTNSILTRVLRFLEYNSLFFQIVAFLQRRRNNVEHLRGEVFRLKNLDENIYLGPVNFKRTLKAYNPFFNANKRIEFFKHGNCIFARVKGYVFALPFPQGVQDLEEVFLKELYGKFNVNGGTVVDVGAFIGDTALFFYSKGARRVVAFEPATPLYKFALQNVAINHAESTIEIRNEAVSDKNGFLELNYLDEALASSTLYDSHKARAISFLGSSVERVQIFRVKSITLADIMSSLDYVDLLKLNCEEAEHDILRQAHEQRLFGKIGSIIMMVHGCRSMDEKDTRLRSYLKEAGYIIVQEERIGEKNSYIYATKNEHAYSSIP